MYEIEKGVPRPTSYGLRKYPFDKMEIEDSFFIPKEDRVAVGSAACNWGKKNGGRKFSIRPDGAGARIWRVA